MAIESDQASRTSAPSAFRPNLESLRAFRVPEWFRDAKLGIWSHWGPQSVPRQGDWYARNMYIPGTSAYNHHVRTYGHPSRTGYRELVARWKAENFDPEHLMQLYARAGARYFVAQAVHHDHFLNYGSKLHRWNSVEVGPGLDIVQAWKDAATRHDLPFGITEHLGATFSWWGVNKGTDPTGRYAGVPYDGTDPAHEDFYLPNQEHGRGTEAASHPPRPWYTPNRWWHARWLELVTEMIDRFQPDLLYSDGTLPFGEHGYDAGMQAVAQLYNQSASQHDGVNRAVYNHKGHEPELDGIGVLDIERSQQPDVTPFVWQTDTCVGSWFYNDAASYKQPGHVIEILVDVVAKNGNLLLNIPQRPDGSLDDECTYLLEQLADWTAICGEGIFGSRPFRVGGEGPSSVLIDGFREDRVDWTAADYRFTMQGNTLYAFQMRWPDDRRAVLRSLGPNDRVWSVRLLGGEALPFQQVEGVLVVSLPDQPPSPYVNGLAIELDNR